MLRGLLRKDGRVSSHSLDALSEQENLRAAMQAVLHIMEDDLEGAEAGLTSGDSSFHKLFKGMVSFFKATLGFEPQMIKEASERLADAEATAIADTRRAQSTTGGFKSEIYPVGSEYILCHAEIQLMLAVVGVLNESLTESIKGFYKLRKAYIALDGIIAAEERYMKKMQKAHVPDGDPESQQSAAAPRSTSARNPIHLKQAGSEPVFGNVFDDYDDDDDEFYDIDEYHEQVVPDVYHGRFVLPNRTNGIEQSPEEAARPTRFRATPAGSMVLSSDTFRHEPDSEIFSNPTDAFIHSGSSLCLGFLLVILSLIPPAFGKLLFIIGFHGDKARGMRLLWQASKFHNINGAFGGLIVLGFYNALVGLADILPDGGRTYDGGLIMDGYPRQRCESLLADMRNRHPKSHLWLLEEARMHAINKQLSIAIQTLNTPNKSPLKQIEALEFFEMSLNAMYSHEYQLCSTSFIKCVSLNNWSHSLYYYIAGAAEVELYRLHKQADLKEAKKHEGKAIELLKLAPQFAGKKKFMARRLPFDVFVVRKIKKWEARAEAWQVPFIDAVGVSPLEEMIMFWNGYKRQNQSHLEVNLQRLAWSETSATWSREENDERAILALLRAATLRTLGRFDAAKAVLRSGVLSIDRNELKGDLRDNWTAPAAHYEMGVICWMEHKQYMSPGSIDPGAAAKCVKECETWIDQAAKWEGYELDTRVGLKITQAQDTLRQWHERRNESA